MSGAGMSRLGPTSFAILSISERAIRSQLVLLEAAGVDVDAALGAAERDAGDGGLPGHHRGERADLVDVDLGVEAHAALVGAAGAVVLDPEAVEDVHLPVGELDRDLDRDLPVGLPEDLARVLLQAEAVPGAVEVVADDLELGDSRPPDPRIRLGSFNVSVAIALLPVDGCPRASSHSYVPAAASYNRCDGAIAQLARAFGLHPEVVGSSPTGSIGTDAVDASPRHCPLPARRFRRSAGCPSRAAGRAARRRRRRRGRGRAASRDAGEPADVVGVGEDVDGAQHDLGADAEERPRAPRRRGRRARSRSGRRSAPRPRRRARSPGLRLAADERGERVERQDRGDHQRRARAADRTARSAARRRPEPHPHPPERDGPGRRP